MSHTGISELRTTGLDLTSASDFEGIMTALQQRIDPFGVTTSLLNAQVAWMMHSQELSQAMVIAAK